MLLFNGGTLVYLSQDFTWKGTVNGSLIFRFEDSAKQGTLETLMNLSIGRQSQEDLT